VKWRKIVPGDAIIAPGPGAQGITGNKIVYVVVRVKPMEENPLRVEVTFLGPDRVFENDFALDSDVAWEVWCKVGPSRRTIETT
jgi:hypothetical protein